MGKTDNSRDTYVDLKTKKVDDVDVKSSDIKINVASIEKIIKEGGAFSGVELKGLKVDELLGAVLGYEIEYTTKENNLISAKKEDAEKPAHDTSKKILNETKEKKK